MKEITTVLVTGSHGYIGSLLTPLLVQAGYRVVGLDTNYFDDAECVFKHLDNGEHRFIKKDIRRVTAEDLRGIDAICHLAALSNDPLGALNEQLTLDVNLRASIKLAEAAHKAQVKRFLFSSSCSVYGKIGDQAIAEEAPLDPKTAYAVSKVEFEKFLLALADKHFCAVSLRNATAYGSSPKLRLDLVLNNLAAHAFTRREIKLVSDGTPWRPMIHAEDIARLFLAFLEAPAERVSGETVNCGRDEENFQIKDIAGIVQSQFKNARITYAEKSEQDSRTYRVSFSKLKKLVPNFTFKWTLKKSAGELRQDFASFGLPHDALSMRNFIRLKQLEYLIAANRVDSNLFWRCLS